MSDPNAPNGPGSSEPTAPTWSPPTSVWEPRTESTQTHSAVNNDIFDAPSDTGGTSHSRRWIAIALVAALIGGLIGGIVGARVGDDDGPTANGTSPLSLSNSSNTPATPNAIRAVLNAVQPAVVSIRGLKGGTPESGTGMIISSDGDILTNSHVVDGVRDIRVTLNGERDSRPATLVGQDPTIDTAIVRLNNASNLPVVTLGESGSAQVGDEVIAIGNALALPGGPSVTDGIVSAKDRSLDNLDNLIQTDAPINPGNSGGPLVNLAGQVIGMNTAVIRGESGEFQGIGFAIAIDAVKPALEQLRSGQSVQYAFLGVTPAPLTDFLKSRFNVPVNEGAVVNEVQPDSPADDAGISRFDVITELGGKEIDDSAALFTQVRAHKPNDRVKVVFYRGSDKREVEVTLTTRPDASRN